MKGRSYAVDIKYGVCKKSKKIKFIFIFILGLANKRSEEAVTAAIRMHLHEGPGDILVFLTGSEECEMARILCMKKLEDLVA